MYFTSLLSRKSKSGNVDSLGHTVLLSPAQASSLSEHCVRFICPHFSWMSGLGASGIILEERGENRYFLLAWRPGPPATTSVHRKLQLLQEILHIFFFPSSVFSSATRTVNYQRDSVFTDRKNRVSFLSQRVRGSWYQTGCSAFLDSWGLSITLWFSPPTACGKISELEQSSQFFHPHPCYRKDQTLNPTR